MNKVLTDSQPIRLKGRSFLALVLSPEAPIDRWLLQLDDLASRSAGFFLGKPIVLDVENLQTDRAGLALLIEELAKRGVSIMGIEGARPSLLAPGMPPAMRGGKSATDFQAPAATAAIEPRGGNAKPPFTSANASSGAQVRVMPSIIIKEPVRSGQSVIFPEGDVTIIGSVASGAEVVAGGSIHVYGTLRGRAMAGSAGNASARIFCRKLEAELLAIDGLYKTAEDLEPRLRGKAVQLWLEGDTILAEAFG
ncbi:septum site-determining protein MinC [Phyllobacterium sp.]|uniref:septum site-determining protein MinC n=1 Tax=unclassified Phyllobacterium TaxID=2638441 RepID=UPI0031FD7DB4|nr:septum site-determining protein MinC [Phyllobacterium sp.]